MTEKVGVALIGAGWMGGVHAAGYVKMPDVQLVAVSDVDRARAESFAKDYNIPHVYTDYREMLRRDDIAAVDVTTPPFNHLEIVRDVLRAGKHGSVQKPITLTMEEANAMVAEAEGSKKILMASYMYRFAPLTKKVKELIEEGNLGEPRMGYHRMMIPTWRPGPWTWDSSLSGGMIVEMLTHGFDLYNWYIGKPVRVHAAGNCTRRPGFVDMACVTVTYENGAVVSVQATWAAPDNFPTSKIELIGSKGAIYFEGGTFASASPMYRLTFVDGETAHSWENPGRGQTEKLRAYVDAIKSGDASGLPTVRDGRAALEVALAARKSIEEGCIVDLPLA